MTFGSKIINFYDLSSEEQKSFLLENKVIFKRQVLPVERDNLGNSFSDLTTSVSSEKLDLHDFLFKNDRFLVDINKMIEREEILDPYKNDLYFYLVYKYQQAINLELLKYRIESNDDFIGVENFNDQKQIALEYFKDYFNDIKNDGILQMQSDNLSGPGQVENYFYFINRTRENLKENLVHEKELILNYLVGNKDYFDGFLINSNSFLKDMILFESRLKVLVILNTKYNFIENDYFTLTAHLDHYYINLKDKLFLSSIAVEFVSEFFRNNIKVSLVEISCIFHVLKEAKLIENKKKLFLDFINNNFKNPFPNTEIRNSGKSINHSDKDRILKYEEDLKAYIALTRSV